MQTIISLIFFIILLYWIGQIYFSEKKKFRVVKYRQGESYLLSRNMYFVIFTICTAPVFLHSISLLKYGLWFVMVLLLLFTRKVHTKFEAVTVMYMVFFFWLCYTMTYTTTPYDGVMMLIKYSLPMLFLWLGYSGLNNEKDLIILLRTVNLVACIYCFIIGGFGYKLMPWLYFSPIGGLFSKYAGFSDYLTSIFIVPILLYWTTKEKKYIFCALWMVLSTILYSVRTGMGGMMLVFAFAMFLRYKAKAIPSLLFAGAMFVGVILFVPEVNEKFFGEKAGKVTAGDIVQGDALSLGNIEMSGREYMWQRVKDNCFYGNETFGGGLGTSGRFVKDYGKAHLTLEVMHNDYLQIICDTGLVGITLLTIFYIMVIIKVMYHVMARRSTALVKYTGIMALSSMVGIGFSMYFDNIVSNSMQSMVMPYIFLGFFLKALDLEKNEKNNNLSTINPNDIQNPIKQQTLR